MHGTRQNGPTAAERQEMERQRRSQYVVRNPATGGPRSRCRLAVNGASFPPAVADPFDWGTHRVKGESTLFPGVASPSKNAACAREAFLLTTGRIFPNEVVDAACDEDPPSGGNVGDDPPAGLAVAVRSRGRGA